ncbi:hypothetical protein N7528_003927 [Penicillium herquei]|nr:hypothetical protein N7528_003927 [Penicillium herquei]
MSNTRTANPCKWHSMLSPEQLTGDWMGPTINVEHVEHVRAERAKRLESAQPDSYLRAGDATEKVFLEDFRRESYSCMQWYPENGHKGHDLFTCKGPVLPVFLPKITDFLYTGSYALSVGDILAFAAGYRGYKTGCAVCDDTCQYLRYHHGLFHAARFLQMEGLQRLCINEFAQIVENSPPPLVHLAVREIYSTYPEVCENQLEDVFTLGEMFDYRENFLRPAVTKWLRNPQQEAFFQGSKEDKHLTFQDLRANYADFDKHFAKWEQQALAPEEPLVAW